jgi:hypothetical protein
LPETLFVFGKLTSVRHCGQRATRPAKVAGALSFRPQVGQSTLIDVDVGTFDTTSGRLQYSFSSDRPVKRRRMTTSRVESRARQTREKPRCYKARLIRCRGCSTPTILPCPSRRPRVFQ